MKLNKVRETNWIVGARQVKSYISSLYIQHYKVLVLAGHQPCQDKPLRCQFVAVSALSPSYKASIRVAKKITVAIDKLIWLTRRTPASYSHEQISSIKPPLTVLRCCVWSGPPLQR